MYGAGLYFAEHCSKSDQYCKPFPDSDPINGSYFLFLSRVCFGTPFHTKVQMPGTRAAPLRDERNPRMGRWDSVLAATAEGRKYREFIVYDRAQAYPEFIVEFKRR
jgi:hypothetical protein